MPRYVIRSRRPARPEFRLDDLNEQQRAAVLHASGPALVIAGAGTGKTRTLTHRAAYLLHNGVDPDNILLCTFTNRAAREMVKRVEGLLDLRCHHLWAGTFHHVANLALRSNADQIGLPENYSILDQEDARDLISGCLADEGKALRSKRFPTPAVIQQLVSLTVNNQQKLTETVMHNAPKFIDLGEELTRVVDRYATRKLKLGLVDYDDLLLFFKILLTEHDKTRRELTSQFEYVLVDEYQDTTRLQGEIVDLCGREHGNVMVVGDDAQSIYAFRGAHFANIINFPKRYPKAKVYKLEQNYRSTPEILTLANASIGVNRRQHPKVLRPVRGSGMKPPLLPLYDVHQQAAFVGQRVLELSQQENVRLRDIAVLYRAHSHSLELQVELTRRKIPFSVRSGLRFFEQAHVKDVVAYLRLVHNAGDTLAWQRVLKLWSGVGKKSAEKVVGQVSATRSPAAKALDSADLLKQLPSNARPAIRRLADLLAQIDVEDARPDTVIQTVLDGHYRAYAEGRFSNSDIRVEDLEQLADFASRYESLELFLSELAIVAGVAAEAIGPGEMPEERMTLSTIHQAKGLEWRAVFIIGLAEGKFPQAMAARNDADMEEERRLFHVASTRAMDQLYLCYPRFEETTHGPRRLLRLSRFLSELRSQPIPFERWEIDEVQVDE